MLCELPPWPWACRCQESQSSRHWGPGSCQLTHSSRVPTSNFKDHRGAGQNKTLASAYVWRDTAVTINSSKQSVRLSGFTTWQMSLGDIQALRKNPSTGGADHPSNHLSRFISHPRKNKVFPILLSDTFGPQMSSVVKTRDLMLTGTTLGIKSDRDQRWCAGWHFRGGVPLCNCHGAPFFFFFQQWEEKAQVVTIWSQ